MRNCPKYGNMLCGCADVDATGGVWGDYLVLATSRSTWTAVLSLAGPYWHLHSGGVFRVFFVNDLM